MFKPFNLHWLKGLISNDLLILFFLSSFILPINIVLAQEGIVINEIMYDPPGDEDNNEWVELYNPGTNSTNLDGWKFYDGATHTLTLSSGTLTIQANGYVVLAKNTTTFTSSYPTFTGILIEVSSLELDNGSATLCLITKEDVRVGSVTYSSTWGANNNDKTLEKILPCGDNTAHNWGESIEVGGTPGRINSRTSDIITITHPCFPGAQGSSSYLIGWKAQTPGSITLYYTTNTIGLNKTTITTNITKAQSYYEWKIPENLPEGIYYIYAKLEDGINPPIYSYNSGPIIIDRSQYDSKTLPWHNDGIWLRGDIHTHTNMSDGSYSAGTVAQYAVDFGADFIAITDHPNNNISSITYHLSILEARKLSPNLIIFEGVEWNVPGAGHGGHATVLVTNSPREHGIISSFTTTFDFAGAGTDNEAIEALEWLKTWNVNDVIPICSLNHPSRPTNVGTRGFRIEQLRAYSKVDSVCIGFSGDIGHKKTPMVTGYAKLAGGFHDPMTALIGGNWDTLLNENRNWWIRFEDDFHNESMDYWPCEFSQTRVYCPSKTYEGVIKGLRAGCAYAVHGNIITNLEFLGIAGTQSAMMGEVLFVRQGEIVTASIRVLPNTDTTIDKIELISNVNGTPTSTKVFSSSDWSLKDAWLEMKYPFTNVQDDFYFRIRGNSSASPVNLWFYSNPIRVKIKQPYLILEKECIGTASSGGTLTYILRYKNEGDGIARSAHVIDMIPEGTEYVIGSAKVKEGLPADLYYSHDGGSNFDPYGTISPITHIKWEIKDIYPMEGGELGFEVVIK